jgi:hypothetical protein
MHAEQLPLHLPLLATGSHANHGASTARDPIHVPIVFKLHLSARRGHLCPLLVPYRKLTSPHTVGRFSARREATDELFRQASSLSYQRLIDALSLSLMTFLAASRSLSRAALKRIKAAPWLSRLGASALSPRSSGWFPSAYTSIYPYILRTSMDYQQQIGNLVKSWDLSDSYWPNLRRPSLLVDCQ